MATAAKRKSGVRSAVGRSRAAAVLSFALLLAGQLLAAAQSSDDEKLTDFVGKIVAAQRAVAQVVADTNDLDLVLSNLLERQVTTELARAKGDAIRAKLAADSAAFKQLVTSLVVPDFSDQSAHEAMAVVATQLNETQAFLEQFSGEIISDLANALAGKPVDAIKLAIRRLEGLKYKLQGDRRMLILQTTIASTQKDPYTPVRLQLALTVAASKGVLVNLIDAGESVLHRPTQPINISSNMVTARESLQREQNAITAGEHAAAAMAAGAVDLIDRLVDDPATAQKGRELQSYIAALTGNFRATFDLERQIWKRLDSAVAALERAQSATDVFDVWQEITPMIDEFDTRRSTLAMQRMQITLQRP
jgi:hypothetical protein